MKDKDDRELREHTLWWVKKNSTRLNQLLKKLGPDGLLALARREMERRRG